MKEKIRIKDVALKAGVSTGTVDRVIHNRGNVSKKAKEKVLMALEEMEYSPNLIASALAYNKEWKIAVLIPDAQKDHFWQQPKDGIDLALKAVADYGLRVTYFHFRENDVNAFKSQANEILNGNFNAVIVSPIFTKQSITFFKSLQQNGIPFIQINTCLDFDSDMNLSYIGQDSYYSGLLAAKLLAFGVQSCDAVMILHLEEKVYNAQHLIDKENGFHAYFNERKNLGVEVINSHYTDPYNSKGLHLFLKNSLADHPNIKGIFITTSRSFRVVKTLESIHKPGIKIVGFDLIEENLNYLEEEKIDFLINQNPHKQGYLAIINLFNYWFRKIIPSKYQHLPLDIVMKENASYYTEKKIEEIPLIV